MPRLRFTQDQRAAIVSELNAGEMAAKLSHRYGVSINTLYRWRAMCAKNQQPAVDSQRLRSLEDENQRLKRQFAELTLDYATLRSALIRDVRGDC
jgi:putative transposase